jgi:DNA-binding MarR family transcriptional regulator
MSNKLNLVKKLLKFIEDYENEMNNDDLNQFSIYLYENLTKKESDAKSVPEEIKDFKNYKQIPTVEFSTLLVQLFKYARSYTKKVFQDKPWNSLDEYGFLASLLVTESMSKHDLSEMHMLEMSSGSEIIKRLLKNNLIHEFTDIDDKRIKRVALTENGRTELLSAFEEMHKVSKIVIGNLSNEELFKAINIFRKLSLFHNQIHKYDRNAEIPELYSKYIWKQ